MVEPLFKIEFRHAGTHYLADVRYSAALPLTDKLRYKIREHSFLVHLFSSTGFRSFEMFIDEDAFTWATNEDGLIGYELVELLGNKIDQRFS